MTYFQLVDAEICGRGSMSFWRGCSKLLKRFRVLTGKMDEGDLDPTDIVAYITEELQVRYRNAKDTATQAEVFRDFLHRWDSDSGLDVLKKMQIEFEKDLDWFNVSEPLSLEKLRGKLVVLDFFTYCCINCMHVLPELHALEHLFPVGRGLVVIGVHSPKFENEKDTANIVAAAQRYGIVHPIVNDRRLSLWRAVGVRCWPTLLVLAPSGAPLLLLMGEGHRDFLELFVEQALTFFEQQKALANFPLPLRTSLDLLPASNLRFPAKIARSEDGNFAIADAGNNRILIVDPAGVVLYKVGGGEAGFVDGSLVSARFNSPQGVTFLSKDVLIVADTENHAVRQVTLSADRVETLAGTGQQGHDRIGGKMGPLQAISSPWDVVVFRTRDMDMSFHLDEQNVPEKEIILIAMAGTHQIWAYFPEGMIWWKFRTFDPRICVSLIGNGVEENRNNSYPQNAAFAQPSGLAMAKNFLFIADSESSSIRKVSMVDGKVLAVVGGDRNPQNLFAFGDVDGKQYDAKLQHPLDVAYNHINGKVYVADTYNHKIKVIDVDGDSIETLSIKQSDGTTIHKFNEPAGLCFDADAKHMLVSDTNNHQIQIVNMQTLQTQPFQLKFEQCVETCVTDGPVRGELELLKRVPLRTCKKLKLTVAINLEDTLKFTEEAPQKWRLNAANTGLRAATTSGTFSDGKFSLQMERLESASPCTEKEVKLEISLNLCDDKSCLMKRFSLILSDSEAESSVTDSMNSDLEEQNVQIHISSSDIRLS